MSDVKWDGATYDRISAPQAGWGKDVLARLELNGDEVVLDAGCGSGRVTEMLLERLPRGRVIAVDGSPSMAEAARRRLGGAVEVRVMDLLELSLKERVDVVVSTATFHWITDHDALFARLHAVLQPGGRLVAQCGGEGNVENVVAIAAEVGKSEPFRAHLGGWRGPWLFALPEQTEHALRAAGFQAARCWLVPAPLVPPEPREFLRSVILGPHLAQLPPELADRFVDAVLQRLPDPPVIDYVRLNIDAVA